MEKRKMNIRRSYLMEKWNNVSGSAPQQVHREQQFNFSPGADRGHRVQATSSHDDLRPIRC